MYKKTIKQIQGHGMPVYEMKSLFTAKGQFTNMQFSYIMIQPRQRVPQEGFSKHTQDEYSYIVSGKLFSHNAGVESYVQAGDATLIPKGEEHWCENVGEEPVVIICTMLE